MEFKSLQVASGYEAENILTQFAPATLAELIDVSTGYRL